MTNFTILLASKGDFKSDIKDYLIQLIDTNPALGRKAISNLQYLSKKIEGNQDIKPMKNLGVKFFELKVQSKSNICRFFFVIEEPNVIVLYGFTKKTQKTDKKDLNAGIRAYENYKETKLTIPFAIFFDNL